jgi:hypothetical protein
MLRFFRKPAAPPSPLATAPDGRRERAQVLLRQAAGLALNEERGFTSRIRAWAESPVPDEAEERALVEQIAAAHQRALAREDEAEVLVGKLRESLDALRALASGLPDPERARWRRWLAQASLTVQEARERHDPATLASLLIEVRDGEHALRTRACPLPENDAAWSGRVSQARRLLDHCFHLVRRLPAAREIRLRERLERLQRQFAGALDRGDTRSARVLLIHLEDAEEDIRREIATAEGEVTASGAPVGRSILPKPRR